MSSNVTIQKNTNFELQFNIAKDGYTTICIVGYSLSNRSLGGHVFITGEYFDALKVILYGYNNADIIATVDTGAWVYVLYKNNS